MQIRNNGVYFKGLSIYSLDSLNNANSKKVESVRLDLEKMSDDVDVVISGGHRNSYGYCSPYLYYSVDGLKGSRKVREDQKRILCRSKDHVPVYLRAEVDGYNLNSIISPKEIVDNLARLKKLFYRVNDLKNADVAIYNLRKTLRDNEYNDSIKLDNEEGIQELGREVVEDLHKAVKSIEVKQIYIEDTDFTVKPHFSKKCGYLNNGLEITAYEKGGDCSEKSPHAKRCTHVHRLNSSSDDIVKAFEEARDALRKGIYSP